MKEKIKEYIIITLGTILLAIGIYFFKFPNNFSTGGVSGISVILAGLYPNISSSLAMMIINILLLVIGFIFIKSDFCIKTVYCSLLLSVSTYVLEVICPLSAPLTKQPVLELVFAIFLPAVSSAILFNYDASTGGTDIVAMLIKKYSKSSLNISKALFLSDVLIVMATFFVFGAETWLFSLLGFLSKIFVVNGVVENLNTSKYFTIITDKEKEIRKFITVDLHKGATISKNYSGAFSNSDKSVILTVVKRHHAIELKNFVKKVDPHAFVIITSTSDIIGKGFRETV